MATEVHQYSVGNKCAEFLLGYQPGAVKSLPLISPFARALAEKNHKRLFTEAEVIKALETDPFLSAKLVGTANSIFFNRRHLSFCTVHEALKCVGSDYVIELIRKAPCLALDIEGWKEIQRFWIHSIGVAYAAKALSRWTSKIVLDTNTVFLAGLIHNIGRLLEVHYDPRRVAFIANLLCGEKENRFRAGSHSQHSHLMLGESLSRAWSLPQVLTDAIRWHRSPGDCPSDEGKIISALLRLADMLVSRRLTKRSIDIKACAVAMTIAGINYNQLVVVENTVAGWANSWNTQNELQLLERMDDRIGSSIRYATEVLPLGANC